MGVKSSRLFTSPRASRVIYRAVAAQGIDAKADNAGVVVAVGAVWVDAFDGRNGRTNRPPLSLRNSAPDRTQRKLAARSLAIRPSLVMVTATPRSPRSAWRFLAQEIALRVQLRHVCSNWRVRCFGLHVVVHECLRRQVFLTPQPR